MPYSTPVYPKDCTIVPQFGVNGPRWRFFMITDEQEQYLINLVIDKIDSLRVEHSYSIYELAKRADVSHNTLKKLYKRETTPTVYTIYRLCQAFNMSLEDFFRFDSTKGAVSMQEMELLENLRKLSPKAKLALLEISRYLK